MRSLRATADVRSGYDQLHEQIVPSWIEFHDSTLTAITQTPGTRELVLEAYVHRWELIGDRWRGTGWEQPVFIRMQNVIGSAAAAVLPAVVWDGTLRAAGMTEDSMVPLPFEVEGDFSLSLHLADGRTLDFTGRGLQIETSGGARFVEALPDDMKPPDLSPRPFFDPR